MIAYICDWCEESIPKDEERYLIKVMEVNRKIKLPNTICLCEKCKKSWEENLPQLFDMEARKL